MAEERIVLRDIEDEVKSSYIDYAMSVIVGRALPDVRDGLKPVHRRILYAMHKMGLTHNKPYKKSAGVVGEVLKNYHPHGDVAVYDTLVRLAQDFSSRYPLIDGQGNFGSVDGDPPAAMRYTEIRLANISEEMLADIEKDTVDFIPNYDESTVEPVLIPAKLPNLLVNGSSGIAVGMATNIPPHNLGEVVDGTIAMLKDPQISIDELMKYIKGPDFPTGGYILGKEGIKNAYRTGRGTVQVQAKAHIETAKGEKEKIIITAIPYQANKSHIIENIANLVRDKKIEGISDIRDESDRDGMRIVIDIKRDENGQVVLNQIFKHTELRTSFGIIMLALVDGVPLVLNLKQVIGYYIDHRKNVVIRRTKFDLDKAEKRAHILEGLKIALSALDKIIKIIRTSKNAEEAKASLMKNFKLSDVQAQAILDMRLQQLTALERIKIEEEYKELLKTIDSLKYILATPKKVIEIIEDELVRMKERYADPRRAELIGEAQDINIEDLITEEEVVVTLSHAGYIKRMPVSTYKSQRRGGVGVTGMETREEDFVEDIFITTTHNYILAFTNKGRIYWLKVYDVPESGRYAKGKPIVNLLKFGADEKITATVAVREFDEKSNLVMVTKNGIVKKIKLDTFSKPRSTGVIALGLKDKDELIDVKLLKEEGDVLLATHHGKAIRFLSSQIREIGRSGCGVLGIRLAKGDFVVGAANVEKSMHILTVTSNGFGKRSDASEYRVQSRGGKGVTNIKATTRNGLVIGIKAVTENDEVIIITTSGQTIRIAVKGIRCTGRSTQGVHLIRLKDKDRVSALARLVS